MREALEVSRQAFQAKKYLQIPIKTHSKVSKLG